MRACAVGAVHNFGRGLWLGKYTAQLANLLQILFRLVLEADPRVTFTSVQLNQDCTAGLHVD